MDFVTAVALLLACVSYLWFQYRNNLQIRSTHGSRREDRAAEESQEGRVSLNRQPLEVLYPGPTDPDKIDIDIVAVHGLGSDVDWSWTWKNGAKCVHWLKDPEMLPAIIPNARIMAYSYESRWHRNASKTRLELCGEELARNMHNFRTNVPDRPVIFIAHSLGGLVVLHALLYADRTDELKYLPARTVGFAAFGTPFRGTKMQSLAEIVARLLVPVGSHDGIIAELKQDTKSLTDKVHAFGQLRNKLDIPTWCFVELCDSDYGKKLSIPGLFRGRVVDEESAHVPGWERVGLNTDHFKLNKFSAPDDRSFLAVSNEILTEKPPFIVPFGRNEDFVGRESILQQLLDRIPPSANKDDCQRTAVEGLGGVGKTQVALEAAYRIRDEHPACSVFWVPAVDSISFEKAYREIGKALGVQGLDDDKADVKSLVKAALSRESVGNWLLVVDNADDLKLLFTDPVLTNYLPFSRKGSILFTTRNHEAVVRLDIREHIITLKEMSDTEATKLLQTGLKENQTSDTESTARLVEFLANLPLAVKQASAYMAKTGISTTKYLNYCQSSDKTMAELLIDKEVNASLLFNVAESYSMLENMNNLAFVLRSQGKYEEAEQMHRETLELIKAVLGKEHPNTLASMNNLAGVLRSQGKYKEAEQMHRQALKLREAVLGRKHPDTLTSMNNLALVLDSQGKCDEAEQMYRHALELKEEVLGKENPSTFASMNNIANVIRSQGKYEEAEQMHRQALELSEAVLGQEHPFTLTSMNSLANVFHSQGKYEEAEQMHRQALKLREAVLSREHPDIFTSMKNLAFVLRSQEKYAEAEQMHRQTLELREAVLGRKHPDTLTSMNNLALVLDSQGKYEKADQMHRQALELNEKVLGKDHPSTLGSMINLAGILES
ncbi:hypothetical protein DL764_007724 [Monosporascus ibericus]|uniref:Uncharacterized protein n=1 Tax=Monosporascus ibericus TaxID=155417 RepID=A0A4Q4T244_9PEZI|nr:hypothetical protein DL764_007724 [Monosporascus ibericus]